jgi:hypothetical protein
MLTRFCSPNADLLKQSFRNPQIIHQYFDGTDKKTTKPGAWSQIFHPSSRQLNKAQI